MSKVIKVENLSKAYQLGDFGTGTISRDIERYWARIRGKEDPFLKIGETNDRTTKGKSDMVWSLKDLNFDIEQGDAVGIIGRNGAGKSTLLKILSRVTSPTTGSVKIKGRIASLLEVGTGFHPELTGRENIYLNGAILGMRKAEIKRKFDEIVDFSGVERYIDTPVKRYSSGMYVRLAFAVAAHLESEILIVDEVLAVGDAEFQKKCLGKMDEVSKGEGRTVLFVSHQMDSILSLCRSGILLNDGSLSIFGDIKTAVNNYSNLYRNNVDIKFTNGTINWLGVEKVTLNNSDSIDLEVKFSSNKALENFYVDFGIKQDNYANGYVLHLRHEFASAKGFQVNEKKDFTLTLNIDPCFLVPGNYKLTVYFYTKLEGNIFWIENVDAFDITPLSTFGPLDNVIPVNAPIIPKFSVNLVTQ